MCDSLVMPSTSGESRSTSTDVLNSCSSYCNSETQLDLVDHLCKEASLSEACNVMEGTTKSGTFIKTNHSFPYKMQLEQDVKRLQRQLQEEMEMHVILENAIENNAVQLTDPSCLPEHAQELLSTIAVLEVTVSKLEQEIVSLHFLLSQERNERRLAEYRFRHSAYQSISSCSSDIMKPEISSSRCINHSDSDSQPCQTDEDALCKDRSLKSTSETTSDQFVIPDSVMPTAFFHERKASAKTNTKSCHSVEFKRLPKGMPATGFRDHPNQLSEEMVRCMKNIFLSLSDSAVPSKSFGLESQSSPVSPRGHLSNSSWWSSSDHSVITSWAQSPQVEIQSNADVLASDNVFDPYRVRGKLSWAEVGNYGFAREVSWMSVGKNQLEYASGALRRFRILVEQLAKVNPVHLSCNGKLAFWINLYNALIMHAYLAYGFPKSDLKLFSLMQKAAYTVGGNSYSAATIEYVILKMKPPLHRPQIALLLALRKLKVSEEQRKSAIDSYEPLVAFALSCGMYSSPAVRIYTAKNVKEELQEGQHDFIRASVGVSNKGKLLVPKMLHCFAKGFIDDSKLAVWISRYLPPNQAAFVEHCISQRRLSVPSSRNCGILPFDSRFRYLFLPDKVPLSCCETWNM